MVFRRTARRFGISLALVAILAACGGDDDSEPASTSAGGASGGAGGVGGEGGAGGAGGGMSAAFHLSGKLSYEYVAYSASGDGLDYSTLSPRPIRGATVVLLNADDGAEVAKTAAGADGSYSFSYDAPARVKLWVFTETEAPLITVEDNTDDDAVYVLESAQVESGPSAVLDVVAGSGWGGQSYTGARFSAPFAVLDAAYSAARRFLDEVSPPPDLPPVKINWSVNNRPEDGDVESGQIGTSHWDYEELYVLGKADVDTDEFDSHVIVHEWGHYFEGKVSRSESPGGSHGYGDVLDPRIAWSEGFCTALSAMVLEPDTTYADAYGKGQAEGFSYDLEENDISLESSPGWFSESSVEAIAFDLYDGANEPFDKVGVGIPGIYSVMVGGYKSSPALTTLFSFVAALKAQGGASAAAIDAIVTHHTASSAFGVDSIKDEWGTGETHGGGVPSSLPVYTSAVIGGSYKVMLFGGGDFNSLGQNRYLRFSGDGAPVTITSASSADVDLYVFERGVTLAKAESFSGNETVKLNTKSGETYVLNVQGYHGAAAGYSVDVVIKH
jgi:hypothetical protein